MQLYFLGQTLHHKGKCDSALKQTHLIRESQEVPIDVLYQEPMSATKRCEGALN